MADGKKYFCLKKIEEDEVEEKFGIVTRCLAEGGNIHEIWETARLEATMLQDAAGNELGNTPDGFDQTILKFFRNWLPEESGPDLKRYMQYYLKKCASLHPRDMISRLENMNKYLRYIPREIEGEGGDINNPRLIGTRRFTKPELVNIIMFMIP